MGAKVALYGNVQIFPLNACQKESNDLPFEMYLVNIRIQEFELGVLVLPAGGFGSPDPKAVGVPLY